MVCLLRWREKEEKSEEKRVGVLLLKELRWAGLTVHTPPYGMYLSTVPTEPFSGTFRYCSEYLYFTFYSILCNSKLLQLLRESEPVLSCFLLLTNTSQIRSVSTRLQQPGSAQVLIH